MNRQFKDEIEMVYHMERWWKKWKLKMRYFVITFCLAQIAEADSILFWWTYGGKELLSTLSKHENWSNFCKGNLADSIIIIIPHFCSPH